MPNQQYSMRYAAHRFGRDVAVSSRAVCHPCPFCMGVIVGRKTDPRYAVDDTFECTCCPTVIYISPEFAALAS
jgi:hypothetical protein